ncbi:pyroglutamyl-peptidase I [Streptomyces sp. NBC_01456]|uniref:pyroglutamyl-peptidase I n=1 Tax=unclassified Streptomyces TaxID=2593676 RepID=UPI002E319CA6|nr:MULTISPECIES: pyroglutamyl-peptidase I [unclassified Streptomyces]
MTKVLVSGFERYGATPVNPAQGVAEALDGTELKGAAITGLVAPSRWSDCIDVVADAIDRTAPDLVVMLGEYGGRSMITVERIAQNFNDSARYGVADNSGRVWEGDLTDPDGPVAYWSTLPLRAMVLAMRAAGIPSDISDAPGTLMCNHLMYGVLRYVATHGLPPRTGWLHLPHLPEIAALDINLGAPSMSLATSTAGVRVAIAAALEHADDVPAHVPSRLQI